FRGSAAFVQIQAARHFQGQARACCRRRQFRLRYCGRYRAGSAKVLHQYASWLSYRPQTDVRTTDRSGLCETAEQGSIAQIASPVAHGDRCTVERWSSGEIRIAATAGEAAGDPSDTELGYFERLAKRQGIAPRRNQKPRGEQCPFRRWHR